MTRMTKKEFVKKLKQARDEWSLAIEQYDSFIRDLDILDLKD